YSAMRLREFPATDIRALPNYSILDGSHYLRISPSTLKSWVVGRDYRVQSEEKRSRPLIAPAQDKPTLLLSFVNLVEAHVLDAMRHKHGVPLRRVRSALDYVQRQFGDKHPLITQEFKTDGVHLFIEQLGALIIASKGGQIGLRKVFEQHLERIEHDEKGIALRLFPFTRPSHAEQPKIIVIDPRFSFGRPVIVGSGIPTRAVFERYLAGESSDHLAEDFRRTREEIDEAIRCEASVA